MDVSRICLGTMSFSEDGEGWTVDRETSREIVERAIDLGVTFFDTANVYNDGESESILGDVLGAYDRDRFVVATKAETRRGPPGGPSTSSCETAWIGWGWTRSTSTRSTAGTGQRRST